MASKGQRFNKYSEEFKLEVYNAYKSGENGGYRQVAEKYNISGNTLGTWIRKYRKQGSLTNDVNHKRGHHKNPITVEDYKERYKILKKYQAFLKAQRERK